MGPSLEPILANAFLRHYKKGSLDCCSIELTPTLYKRYVDDMFVTFRSRDHVKTIVDYMNTKYRNIRFTFGI